MKKSVIRTLQILSVVSVSLISIDAVEASPLQDSKDNIEITTIQKRPKKGAVEQKVTITGKVTDQRGEPIVGANITIKGTSISVATDMDGRYELANVAPKSILRFTYIGMSDLEVTVGTRTAIYAEMKKVE